MFKIFTKHVSPKGMEKRLEELQEQVAQYQLKEREIEQAKKKQEQGIGTFLNESYLTPILDYIIKERVESLSFVTSVDYFKEADKDLEEYFIGLWYGIIVMDKDKEIIRIPTLIEGDVCLVSELDSTRRKKNLFLASTLAEYLKISLESERYIQPYFTEAQLKQDLKVGEDLFFPKAKEKVNTINQEFLNEIKEEFLKDAK